MRPIFVNKRTPVLGLSIDRIIHHTCKRNFNIRAHGLFTLVYFNCMRLNIVSIQKHVRPGGHVTLENEK